MVRLALPIPPQLTELLRDPTRFASYAVAPGALPPRVVLDQARKVVSPDGRAYRWTAPHLIVFDGGVVGSIGGKGLLEEEQEVEIGYNVAASYRRRGIATLAIGLLTQLANRDGLKVLAHVEPQNEASRRALARNGYHLEAYIRLPDSLDLERWAWSALPDEDEPPLEALDPAL